ncbi:MAG: hypothetical protein EZS28_001014 [Streblomastix strix]|uniref:Uncharacterized protein n=1 Tax=Streblomastix strix TaxID=222440 RepID=A0A5J4X875_9EUKA|nr:MAG: hypothetical protein EZS28_001014 [Streblomastix strix]
MQSLNLQSPKPADEAKDIINEIRVLIGQINEHEKDLVFMKRLLHLIVKAYTSHLDEMNEITQSTPLVDQLLHTLRNLTPKEENEQVIIAAVLCSVGALDQLKQMVFLAHREGRTCGGDFIIWGDVNIKTEDQLQTKEQTKQIVIQKRQKNQAEINSLFQNETNVKDTYAKDKQGMVNKQSQIQQEYALHQEKNDENQIKEQKMQESESSDNEQDKNQKMQSMLEQLQSKISQSNELKKDIQAKQAEKEQLNNQSNKLEKEVSEFKGALVHKKNVGEVIYFSSKDKEEQKEQQKDKDRKKKHKINEKNSDMQNLDDEDYEDVIATGAESDGNEKETRKLRKESEKEKKKESEKEKEKLKDKEKQIKKEKLNEKQMDKQQQEKDKAKKIKDDQDVEKEQEKEKEKEKYQQNQVEEEKMEEVIPLKTKLLKQIVEKGSYRINNEYFNSENSRRVGIIADGDEVLNNIPVPGKNFRAITYDEKGGVIRLGWLEVFRWVPTQKKHRTTIELDLRDEVPYGTLRLFHETDESPILFINVPKRVKVYFAYDNQPTTKFDPQLFKMPKPTEKKYKNGEYEKVIDYNMDISKLN